MKVLDQSQVCPTPVTVPEPSLPLTLFDVIWLSLPSVDRCFFYNLPSSCSTVDFLNNHLPTLKSSLSQTLHHFYPLAGKLRPSPDSDLKFEYRYNHGDSVPLSVLESEDDDFSDLSGVHPREYSRLRRLIPQLVDSQDGKSLLAIQLTFFPNRGVCIGVSIHHIACDGFSYIHFLKSWAAACRSDPSSVPPPSHDRTPLACFRDYALEIMKKVEGFRKAVEDRNKMKENSSPADEADFFAATFTLGSYQIEKLKQSVRARAVRPFHCSSFVVTCAYLWSCSAKLRRYTTDQVVSFPLVADWRRRLQPPPPAMYFGNCVFFTPLVLKGEEILKDDGIAVVSEAIGREIEALGEGFDRNFKRIQDGGSNRPVSKPAMTLAGSPRLRVYEVDFGWGRPVKVEIVSIKNEGFALAESREDAGGVEISVVLPKQEAEEFASVFNEGFQLL